MARAALYREGLVAVALCALGVALGFGFDRPGLALLPLAACASGSSGTAPSDGTVMLKVSGMSCPIRCPREVKEQLEAVPGVREARIDYPAKQAACDVEPGTAPADVAAGLKTPYSGQPLPQ